MVQDFCSWDNIMNYLLLIIVVIAFSVSTAFLKQLAVSWHWTMFAAFIAISIAAHLFDFILLKRAGLIETSILFSFLELTLLTSLGYFVFKENIGAWHIAAISFSFFAALCIAIAERS